MQSEAMPTHSEILLTKEQVAEQLQVDVRTVEQMMHDGALPFYKLGKRNKSAKRDRRIVRFKPSEIMAHLDNARIGKPK